MQWERVENFRFFTWSSIQWTCSSGMETATGRRRRAMNVNTRRGP